MVSKNKIFLLLFFAVVALSLWLFLHSGEGTIRKELWDFAVDDTSAITKIFMADKSGREVALERMRPGHWRVNGKYKARNDAVNHLLDCVKNLDVRQPVAKSAVENVFKSLAASAVKVEIYQKKKLVKKYFVGHDTQDGLGTYMLLTDLNTGKNSTLPFIMFIPGFNGFISVRYFTEEELWRDRTIFALYPDEISSVTMEYPGKPEAGFTLSLSGANEISLWDARGNPVAVFDTLKVKRYLMYFTNIQYEALRNNLRQSLKDSCMAHGARHILKLVDRKKKYYCYKNFS